MYKVTDMMIDGMEVLGVTRAYNQVTDSTVALASILTGKN